jgi:hypothetical protein
MHAGHAGVALVHTMISQNHKEPTRIISSDFDAFVAEVAADIWNTLVETPRFRKLKPLDYVGLFETVARTLARHKDDKAKTEPTTPLNTQTFHRENPDRRADIKGLPS